MLGKDWDADTEEFVRYDLTEDAARTLSHSDESLREALKEKGSLAAVLSIKNGKKYVNYILYFAILHIKW